MELLARALAVSTLLAGFLYLGWRFDTAFSAGPLSVVVYMVEVATFGVLALAAVLVWRVRRHTGLLPPRGTLDVLVRVTDEPVELLHRTLGAATQIAYPHRTYVLNDGPIAGRDDWRAVEELARRHGIPCFTRTSGSEDLTASLNHALVRTVGDFIAVVPADQRCLPRFADDTLGYFAHPEIGFVCTPEGTERSSFRRRALDLLHSLELARDADGCALPLDGVTVFRRAALDATEGFRPGGPGALVQTSYNLHSLGWKSTYQPRSVTVREARGSDGGTFLDDIAGGLRLMLTDNPLFKSGLTVRQRLHYLYASIGPGKKWIPLLVLAVPLVLWLGRDESIRTALAEGPPPEVFAYVMAVLLFVATYGWILGGRPSLPPQTDVDPYRGYSEIAGPLLEPLGEEQSVRFRHVLHPSERRRLSLLVTLNCVVSAVFLGWLLSPEHIPFLGSLEGTPALLGKIVFGCVVIIELIRMLHAVTLWVNAANARDPVPMTCPPGLRVAALTTIVPSKESISVLHGTLVAMRRLRYEEPIDVWVLDEEDSPEVQKLARELGVHHFTRKGRPEYNQASGQFRTRTKGGNYNAWLAEHGKRYDIAVQVDPDHTPVKEMLQRTLGYFRDLDVAFVACPQVYGNLNDGFIAHGAAAQAYIFHGVLQRGGNGLGAPLLEGATVLYRTDVWEQIEGYQDSVIEDHLTGLRVQASMNEQTGNRWKGVYTPDIVSLGEGPTTWTDYFNQQNRWAYGVWDIVLRHSTALMSRLDRRQRLGYTLLQLYYPSVALLWVLGFGATGVYLIGGISAVWLDPGGWIALWGGSIASQLWLFLWLRRFNLATHERRESGLDAILLTQFTGPVYVAAGIAALLGRPLSFAVTAKGALASRDRLGTFRMHLAWAAAAFIALTWSHVEGNTYLSIRFWGLVTLAASLSPVLHSLYMRWRFAPGSQKVAQEQRAPDIDGSLRGEVATRAPTTQLSSS